MNFSGNNSIKNNVFDGGYSIFINPVDTDLSSFWASKNIDPKGITGIFVYYSDGGANIDSGYYAVGANFSKTYLSGASDAGNASGYLYYRLASPLFGACHGFGQDAQTWFNGYNYYNAFHPEGYISPPFGQNTTVFISNQDGRDALAEDGSCAPLTTTEYNDIFGIVSQTDNGIAASTDNLNANSNSFINSPAIGCPQDLSVVYYWNEVQYKLIGGTAGAIAGNTFYNTNPIPSSLDIFDLRTASRYSETTSGLGTYVSNGDGTKSEQVLHTVSYDSYGRPLPAYSTAGGNNTLNTSLCFGMLAESKITQTNGTQIRSLLLDVPDTLGELNKGHFDAFNWWNIWHFLFKENSDGFPFTNGYQAQDDANAGLAKTPNSSNYGSQLFKYTLSDSDHYWENRQCPNGVDFLPHTFGAAIYACPSYHFDVPYYASLNKFGFYGTRFFNGCVSPELTYPSSGYPARGNDNAQELPGNGYSYITPNEGQPQNDKGISYSFSDYDNLLNVARAEQSNSDFFALNKLFFLWANYSSFSSSSSYQYLNNSYAGFAGIINTYLSDFFANYPNGKNDLLTDNNWWVSTDDNYTIYDTGHLSSILNNNSNYKFLKHSINKLLKPEDMYYWNQLESQFAAVILNSDGSVDTNFYSSLESSRNGRFQARYLENYTRGNAIDLYPSNKILFGYDKSRNYLDSYSWGKLLDTFGRGTQFNDTGIEKRYFLGAYGDGEDAEGLSTYLNSIAVLRNSYFYPGFFNSTKGSMLPVDGYAGAITGNIFSSGETVTKTTITGGTNSVGGGWMALGYNGINKIQDNFSCFTPIFIQQPIQTAYCKIGQSPTFRSFAVDYHTIPEDKINNRYPEIIYWTKKLKVVDSSYKNKYPLSYKWYRISKSACNNNFDNFLTSGYFAITSLTDIYHNETGAPPLQPSDPNGTWCCLEGDGPSCTLIHPKSCDPVFSPNPAWSYKYMDTPMYDEARRNNFYMTFKKGAIYESDDLYYYFCIARGRFGIRISQASELFIDRNLQFDISVQNGGNAKINVPISFTDGTTTVAMQTVGASKYAGFARDDIYIPESVIEAQIPPPNRGYGDVYSYRFVGSWKYGGALQSYSPGTLNDTRGLKETWGRFLHYGSLIKYQKQLSQVQGDMLYGKNHLPTCVNGDMPAGKKGVKVVMDGIVHWSTMQKAIAYTPNPTSLFGVNTTAGYGVAWQKLGNAGELYVPTNYSYNGSSVTMSPGIGQWQYGNNLGTIHSFGYKSSQSELEQTPYQLSPQAFQKLKDNLLKNTLGGTDCGWNKNALGRNMLYWIEGFNSFYVFCDPLKKKNVTNYNYMSPALRETNSSIQYFWLGKPTNSYLKRYPMFGPYAYQWKMKAHNRDRNGNGMSEGFYSYGWDSNYSAMYDAPAVYGLFRKYNDPSQAQQDYIGQMNENRLQVFGGAQGSLNVKSTRFGFTYGNGGAVRYGNVWVGQKEPSEDTPELPPSLARDYMNSGEYLAKYPKFNLYGCDDSDLENGDCFDPCLSIRYGNGILPGGKYQGLTTAMPNGAGYKIVPNNKFNDNDSFVTETVDIQGVAFRGPFGTPHHKYLASIGKSINGLSPCTDGGADHCNYITPTINLGASCYTEKNVPDFVSATNTATSAINYPFPPT